MNTSENKYPIEILMVPIIFVVVFIFAALISNSLSVSSLRRGAACVENRVQASIASQERWFYRLKTAEDRRKMIGLDNYYQLRQEAFQIRANEMEQIKKMVCTNR